MKANNSRDMVSSVDKAIDILYFLSKNEMQSIRDLSDSLGISKTTLHRLLQTLEAKRMVFRDSMSEKYYLGYRVLEMGANLVGNSIIREYALPYMHKLAEETGDTTQLAVMEDERIIVLETVDGDSQMRVFAQPGMSYPITYGNFGKVFLAFGKKEVKERVLLDLQDPTDYESSLQKVKKEKVSVGIDTPLEGAISLAVPIFDSDDNVIASLSVVGVKTDSKLKKVDQVKERIKKYGEMITEEFK